MPLADYEGLVHRCFRCGYCKLVEGYSQFNCPSYCRFHFESHAPGGMLWLINAWMEGRLQWTESLGRVLYSCTACNSCVEHCKFEFGDQVLQIMLAARAEMVENGHVLPPVARFFRNIEATGNPFREAPAHRAEWAEGMGVPSYEGHEYLYYVGCVGSYDTSGKVAAAALARVLQKAGVSFGILGESEKCEGNEVNVLGEKRIFDMLVRENARTFGDLGVRKIVALSPHSYNALKNWYPQSFDIAHYTGLLAALIEAGKLRVSREVKARVTYHDPCFLGRHNGEYEAPRTILNAVSGIELVEMERNRSNAFCCGGGSGNFYIDSFGGGEESPARTRVREACETGAEVLAVACPTCKTMLTDAVKSEQLESKLTVRDIAEIVADAIL